MKNEVELAPMILVLEDVEETRDGIVKLLNADGYRVDPVRDEKEAVIKARRDPPDLILISFGGLGVDVMTIACQIRERAELSQNIPVVIFCVGTLAEGAEVEIERNVYATRPDNFNQLLALLRRLLLHPAAVL